MLSQNMGYEGFKGGNTMLKEFKQFAIKGNMIDLAVGMIIGTSFNKIVSSDMIQHVLICKCFYH